MSFNCHSVRNKVHEVMELISSNEIDIICLQETWLRKCDTSIIEEIKEYNFEIITERKPRKCDIGGGVAILYRKNLSLRKLKYKQYPSFEAVTVIFSNSYNQPAITNLYYPGYSDKHKYSHASFLNDFDDFCSTEMIGYENIIVGDFNIHMENEELSATKRMKEVITGNDFYCFNTPPTHKQGGKIDLLMCNSSAHEKILNVELMSHIDISDHYPIQFSLKTQFSPKNKKIYIQSQPITDENIVSISSMIANCEGLLNIIDDIPVQDMVNIYNNNISNICNNVSPICTKIVKERSQQVWYTADLQNLKREKRKAERKFLKSKSDENKQNYRQKCSIYYQSIKDVRTAYYEKLISDKQNDMKSICGIVDKLSGDRKQMIYPTFTEEEAVAEKFAEFFTNKILSIREGIDNGSKISPPIENNIIPPIENNIASLKKFSPITADELDAIFNEMKKKGNKNDPFPVKVLVKCYNDISPYVLHIVNQSISTQEFPSNLKHATVLPLIKDESGDTESLKNYRPLYNTSTLGKTIEKCILKQIINHLTANNLMRTTQSGYKKHHSCETALVKLVYDTQLEIEKK